MGSPSGVGFRAFTRDDIDACMALFDANCPAYFAPNEREEYTSFACGPGSPR